MKSRRVGRIRSRRLRCDCGAQMWPTTLVPRADEGGTGCRVPTLSWACARGHWLIEPRPQERARC